MGSVYTELEDTTKKIAEETIQVVEDVYTIVVEEPWKDIVDPIIEEVFSWFGIEGGLAINSSISRTRILDSAPNMLKEHCLMSQRDGMNIKTRMNNYTKGGAGSSLQTYFYNGKTKFIDGLPNTQLKSVDPKTSEVNTILNGLFGTCTIVTNALSPVRRDFWGDYWLQQNFNLIPSINILQYAGENWQRNTFTYDATNNNYIIGLVRAITTTPIERTTVTIETVGSDETTTTTVDQLESVDNMTTVIENLLVAGTPSVVVTVDTDGTATDGTTVTDVLGTPVVTYDYLVPTERVPLFNVSNYYHTEYIIDSDPNGYTYYWMYERGLGTYTVLDTLGDLYTKSLDMFPIVPIRQKYASIIPGTNRYNSVKDQLQLIGLDVDQLLESINTNPDVAQVGEVFIIMALDANSVSEVSNKALYEMLDIAHAQDWSNLNFSTSSGAYLETGTYNTNVSAQTLTKTLKEGTVCAVGKHTKYVNNTNNSLTLRRQILPDQYVEFQTSGMAGFSIVHKDGEAHTNTQLLTDTSPFLIPMSHGILQKLNAYEEAEILSDTLHIVTYAASTQWVEYYETEYFGEIVKFAAIVVSVVTFGASWKAYGFWVAMGVTVASIGAASAIEWVLEETDNPILRGIAIAAIIALQVYAGTYNPEIAFTGIDVALMSVTATSQASQVYTNFKMKELMEEQAQKQEEYKRELQEIKDSVSHLSDYKEGMFRALRLQTMEYTESPSDFFHRTLNTTPAAGLMDYDRLFDFDTKVDPRKVVV